NHRGAEGTEKKIGTGKSYLPVCCSLCVLGVSVVQFQKTKHRSGCRFPQSATECRAGVLSNKVDFWGWCRVQGREDPSPDGRASRKLEGDASLVPKQPLPGNSRERVKSLYHLVKFGPV